MRILITGAGIAGSAAAVALHKAGFEPVVHEAHPRTGADIGAFLTLASNGMLALGQFDAAGAVAATGFELTSIQVSDEHGNSLAVVPLGLREDPFTRFRCLRRAELGAVLQAEVERRGIPIHHGHRIAGLQEDPAGVTAVFADGTSDRGDLLLGADGLNSAVRTLLDPDAPPPRYAGQNVYYGYTTAGLPAGAAGRIDMVRGSTVAFGFAAAPPGRSTGSAGCPLPNWAPSRSATAQSPRAGNACFPCYSAIPRRPPTSSPRPRTS